MAQTIEIEEHVTVGTLAEKLMLPVTRLITELMKNGVMVTVNERIDFDTAQIIVGELDLDVELVRKAGPEVTPLPRRRSKATGENSSPRPPVIAVMGHVDHGKTSLLDAIRGAGVAQREAGGITQHISAYQVTHSGRIITFLDTPGHEAFAALREHGARLTDLVLIVVAADDGVKPQTKEAIRFAKKAGVKMVIAINKMDKEGADPNRVKQELSEEGLLVEEWGGDTIAVELSAKKKEGIDKLLDMVLLVADVEELTANDKASPHGLVIEAHMEKGRGPVAIMLVEEGTLQNGQFVVSGTTYAKIRNLESTDGKPLQAAGPSTPVIITGFKSLPAFGDAFVVVKDERLARQQAAEAKREGTQTGGRVDIGSSELLKLINRKREVNELPIIVRADVQGSVTSVVDSVRTLDTEEVATRIVATGVGTITENDVRMAHTSGAIVYGFHVDLPPNIKRLVNRDKVSVRLFTVIYELIDDVKQELSNLLAPEIKENSLGKLQVKGVFKTTKTQVICGGEVVSGKLTVPARARVTRGDELIAEVEVTNLKKGPQDVKEVVEGEMCGLDITTTSKLDIQVEDSVELFTTEVVERTL